MVSLRSILLSALMVISTLVLITGFEKDAEAGEFVLSGSGDLLVHLQFPMSNEYVSGTDMRLGGVIGIQPEYRFTKYFGLGLDVGIGGSDSMVGWSGGHGTMVFETYLTAKFIAPLEFLDIWGELGTGTFGMVGNFEGEDGLSHNNQFQWATRARVGFSFHTAPNLDLGFHLGASYLFITDLTIEVGVHFNYRFGE